MRSWIAGVLILVAGCGGSVSGDDESGAAGKAGAAGAAGAAGGMIEPGPFTGTWKGYVENYEFDDSTDTVTMTLYSVSNGVSGIVVFGDRPLYAPPTDPNVGYPPGATFNDYEKWKTSSAPLSGSEYRMDNGVFDGARLQFDVEVRQLWQTWCGMQKSYQTQGGGYGCLPATGGSANPYLNECAYSDLQGNTIQVDCGVYELCAGLPMCQCDASGCTHSKMWTVHLDMQLSSAKADGSVKMGELHSLHLTHQ